MRKFFAFLLATFTLASTAFAAPPVVTLTPSNMIALRDEVTEESVGPIIMSLMTMKEDKVFLYLNSPGGSIIAGNQLVNAIKSSGKKVVCIADFAASMAFSILQACTERYVVPAAILMQHQAASELKGSVSDLKVQMELLEKLAAKLNEDDAKRIGMDLAQFKAKIHGEWWLFDDEVVEAKVADGQVLVKCSPALAAKKDIQVVESLFGTAVITWSSCPLITYPLSVKIEKKKEADLRDFHSWAATLPIDQNWKTRKEVK